MLLLWNKSLSCCELYKNLDDTKFYECIFNWDSKQFSKNKSIYSTEVIKKIIIFLLMSHCFHKIMEDLHRKINIQTTFYTTITVNNEVWHVFVIISLLQTIFKCKFKLVNLHGTRYTGLFFMSSCCGFVIMLTIEFNRIKKYTKINWCYIIWSLEHFLLLLNSIISGLFLQNYFFLAHSTLELLKFWIKG